MSLLPTELVRNYPILPFGDDVDVIIESRSIDSWRCTGNMVAYSDFIDSTYPESNALDIPVDCTIKLNLCPTHGDKLTLFSPALLDYTRLHSSHLGNMVKTLGGIKEAQRRGFVCWTQDIYPQRVYLLELEQQTTDGFGFNDYNRLERMRYSVSGELNRDYNGGDFHSWQRYTKKTPIDCALTMNPSEATDGSKTSSAGIDDCDGPISYLPFSLYSTISMHPNEKLKYNTYYAILLQNNVPIVPVAGPDTDFINYFSDSTPEDKLILFKTVREN
jgi:hypothetical protein